MRKLLKVTTAIMVAGIVAGSIFYACQKNETVPQKEDIFSVKQQKLRSGYFKKVEIYNMDGHGLRHCTRMIAEGLFDWETNNLICYLWSRYEEVDCNSIAMRASIFDMRLAMKTVPADFAVDDDGERTDSTGTGNPCPPYVATNFDNYVITIDGEVLTPNFSKTVFFEDGEELRIDYNYIKNVYWQYLVKSIE